MTLELVVQRLDTDEADEVYRRHVAARFTDPLDVIRCTIWVGDCIFPAPGAYEVALLAEAEMVARRRLTIVPRRSP